MHKLLLLSIVTLPVVLGQESIGCFVPGHCQDSFYIDYLDEHDRDPLVCLEFCQNTPGCNYFTYESRLCMAYATCESFNSTCDGCMSGDVTCPTDGLTCFSPGACQGGVLDLDEYYGDIAACEEICQKSPTCKWWTIYENEGLCLALDDCTEIDTDCVECYHGQRECGWNGDFSCSQDFDATSEPQEFTSPGWPRNYNPDITCNYVINAPLGSNVRMEILDARFGSCSETSGARLMIYDVAENGDEYLLDYLCYDDEAGRVFRSTGQKLIAKLYGYYNGQYAGFKATYSIAP